MADQNTNNASIPPVIDLRQVDQSATGAGSTAAGSTTTATAANTATSVQPKKSKGISLEDEALMASNQMAAPPDKYAVPSMVKEKFPDLVDLIKTTESMNDEERDYWFQIMPIMSEEQISKFRDILVNERDQLKSLDKEYEQELNKLNEKHMLEWKEFETREKRAKIQKAEQKSKEEEAQAEEELLRRLSAD
jgi:hypothetical protein